MEAGISEIMQMFLHDRVEIKLLQGLRKKSNFD